MGKVGGNAAAPSAREFGAVQLLRSLPKEQSKHSAARPPRGEAGVAAQSDTNESRSSFGAPTQISIKAGNLAQERTPISGNRNFVAALVLGSVPHEPLSDVCHSIQAPDTSMNLEAICVDPSADQSETGSTPGRLQRQLFTANARIGGAQVCLSVSVRCASAQVTVRVSGLDHDETDELDRRIRVELSGRGKSLEWIRLNGEWLQPMGRK